MGSGKRSKHKKEKTPVPDTESETNSALTGFDSLDAAAAIWGGSNWKRKGATRARWNVPFKTNAATREGNERWARRPSRSATPLSSLRESGTDLDSESNRSGGS